MASDIDICNLALAKLGSAPIASLGDNNPKAALLNRTYGMLRDKLQRVYLWNFNLRYAELAADTTAPLFEYDFAYPLPSDCLRLRLADVSNHSSKAVGMPAASMGDWNFNRNQNYRIAGNFIYTDVAAPLRIQYSARVTDPTQFDVAFNECFASYLAWQLCEQILGSSQKQQMLGQGFQLSLREARMTNAIELPPETIPDDTFMQSRLSS